MKQMDDNIGDVLKKLEDTGQLDNTIIVFTTTTAPRPRPSRTAAPPRSRAASSPPGKAACALRASSAGRGVIRPRTIKNDIFAALDWLPTLVDIAGGPKAMR